MNDQERLAWCEAAFMDGTADEVSGDVEAPTGHFYRVENFMVLTDSQGFKYLGIHSTVALAEQHFQSLNTEYGDWLGDTD